MSQITEKWKGHTGPMSREEVLDRLSEFESIDLNDFYTNGEKDFEKVVRKGLTHLVRSVTLHGDKVADFEIYNDFSGYVYLVTSEIGLTKIGHAENIERRFCQIDSHSPCKVKLHYSSSLLKNAKEVERSLHARFKSKRVKGEWFRLDDHDLLVAQELIDSCEVVGARSGQAL